MDAQEQSASPKEAKRKRKEQEKETLKKLKQEAKLVEKQNKEKAAAAAAVAAEEAEEDEKTEENEIKNEQVGETLETKPSEMLGEVMTSERAGELGTMTSHVPNETMNQLETGPSLPPQISSLPSSISQSTSLVPNLLHSSLSKTPPPPPVQLQQQLPQLSSQAKLIQPTAQMQLNQILNNNNNNNNPQQPQQQQQAQQQQQQQQTNYQAPQMMRLSDFFTSASSQQVSQPQQPFQASQAPSNSSLQQQLPHQSGWLSLFKKKFKR